jgi:GTP-binding protein
MKITSAEFIKSAVWPLQYPPATMPEIAFVGRSNVGKSRGLLIIRLTALLICTISNLLAIDKWKSFFIPGRFLTVDVFTSTKICISSCPNDYS